MTQLTVTSRQMARATQRVRSPRVDDAQAIARRLRHRAGAKTADAVTATAIAVTLLAALAGWRLPV